MNEAFWALTVSVLLHVTWNLIARRLPPETDALWWVLAAHLLLLGPIAVYGLLTSVQYSGTIIALMAVSAVANSVYFLALRAAYRQAPVAFVYPLVRSSPLLIAIWGWWLFGQTPAAPVWLGIGISLTGLLWLAASARDAAGDRERGALPWAMLAMFATSGYSISDALATRSIDAFAGLIGMVSVGYLASWIALGVQRLAGGQTWIPSARPPWWMLVTGGLGVGLAYALVIHAMRFIDPAIAVTFTNSGIVLATLASITWLGERTQWRTRVASSVVISIGLIVVGFSMN